MKAEDLVLSIEQMNHLKELGVEVEDTAMAFDYDILRINPQWVINVNRQNAPTEYHIPTLTLIEIWNMLPKRITKDGVCYSLLMEYDNVGYFSWQGCEVDSLLEAFGCGEVEEDELSLLYKMLCWVAENGYLKEEEYVGSQR